MAAEVAPSVVAVSQSNGVAYTDQQLAHLVNKLTTLRNAIVAGSHPTLKLPAHSGDKGKPLSAVGAVNVSSLPGLTNGFEKPSPSFGPATSHHPPTNTYSTSQIGNHVSTQHDRVSTNTALGIDPIFLQKHDTLVKAEAHMKRERLEHALEEQAQQKKNMMRCKTHDEYALAEFQVDTVWKNAQELVPPVFSRREGAPNGGASSADSFDENTFYSSQMNESTTTEGEIVEEPKRPARPAKLCRFFLHEKPCPYGNTCQFSHDPAMKARVDGSALQAVDNDPVDHAVEASSRQNKSSPRPPLKKGKDAKNDHPAQESTSQQQKIAQLEAELKAMKEKEFQQSQLDQQAARSHGSVRYVPVGVDEFGREMSLRDPNALPGETQPQELVREYGRRDRNLTPPSASNVRVIRNHITSPYAPQPARVSPLAVAKVSQIQQHQTEGSRTSRIPYAEVVSDGSPIVSTQPLNSRKRRRGRDSGEQNRNVHPRREASPQIRIKEEPTSPPPFHQAQPRRVPVHEASRSVYVETPPRPQERIIYEINNSERSASVYEAEPLGPSVRRVISRNGQHYVANDEPDLRRVVSERQMRAPMSPAPRYAPYPDSEPRVIRASSQAYISPTGQRPPPQYRTSVQPKPPMYIPQGRSPSPPPRQMRSSPLGPPPRAPSVAMAPPPRHVMVDQYGNRFLEPEVRQVSVAPASRPPIQPQYDQYGNRVGEQRYTSVAPRIDPRYEQPALRSASIRRTFAEDEPQYVRRQMSPTSPQYMEYTRPVQVIEPRGEGPSQAPYIDRFPSARVVYQETRAAPVFDQPTEQREGTFRVQSVRPMEDRYEPISRVQSVQPQPRIVQLGERQPMSPQVIPHASARPDGYARPVSYGGVPQYQYTPYGGRQGGHDPEVQEDGTYDAPARIVQRL